MRHYQKGVLFFYKLLILLKEAGDVFFIKQSAVLIKNGQSIKYHLILIAVKDYHQSIFNRHVQLYVVRGFVIKYCNLYTGIGRMVKNIIGKKQI